MTVEQLAEKWVDEWGICCRAENMNANQFAKQAYIAGYNEAQNTITQCNRSALSGVKWHKVSEELPTEEKQYLLKFKDGTIDVLYVGIDGNLEPFTVTRECFDFYKDVEKWCEIPKE